MKFLYLVLLFFVFLQSCVSDDFNNMAQGFTPVTPTQAAVMALDQHNPDKRREGLTLLANSPFGGSPDYLSLYRNYIEHDRDPLVRAAAIKALARFGDTEDALVIVPWLQFERLESEKLKSTQVRRAASNALQRLHNPAVVIALLRSLRNQDEDSQVRNASAIALGQYPQPQVFNGLIEGLQSNDLSINLASAQSLHVLTGQVFGTDWDAWYAWSDRTLKSNQSLFAYRSDYEYPTYQHEERWWDSLIFWEYRIHERPDSPAGLKEDATKSTYEDDDKTSQ
ncbi:MAG: HEAT repeat domain-containing protein [Planctomycetes bacterium]|nr:HEAT repeat domain-containing protein [Planctomycetota bacterium]